MAKDDKDKGQSTIFPIPAYRFKVDIGGTQFSFQDMTSLEAEVKYKEVGKTKTGYRYTATAIEYTDVTFKRGFLKLDEGGLKGIKDMNLIFNAEGLDMTSLDEPLNPVTITITLESETGDALVTWILWHAIPVKWGVSGFDASKNALLIETLAFTYHYFSVA